VALLLRNIVFLVFLASCAVADQGELNSTKSYQCDAELTVVQKGKKVFLTKKSTFYGGEMQTFEQAHGGKYSCKLSGQNSIGMTIRLYDIKPGDYIDISIWKKSTSKEQGSLVISSTKPSTLYERIVMPIVEEETGWQKLHYTFMAMKNYQELIIYGYNPDDEPVYFDDLSIVRHRSRPISYNEEDALEIKISTATMKVLDSLRLRALDNGIIDNTLKDYFDAELKTAKEVIPIQIRLKGDWTDHLQGDKWSFRIKVKPGFSFNGLKSFSIQSPHTRSFLEEYVLHKLLEQEDVLTTRYEFSPVILNNKNLGIYAIEEHFDKQLLEAKKRREGPILKLDEGGHWEQVLYNLKHDVKQRVPSYEAAAVLPFKKGRTVNSEALYSQFLIAQNLLFQYKNHANNPEELFDIELMAKYYAILDIGSVHHSMHWHNHRFYYNPITARLEPIAFDCNAEPIPGIVRLPIAGFRQVHGAKNPSFQNLLFYNVANNSEFQHHYLRYLRAYSNKQFLDRFFEKIADNVRELNLLLSPEFGGYTYSSKNYYKTADAIIEALPGFENSINTNAIHFNAPHPNYVIDKKDSVYFYETGLKAYLSSFEDSISTVKLINYSLHDVAIVGYSEIGEKDSMVSFQEPTNLSAYSSGANSSELKISNRVSHVWLSSNGISNAKLIQKKVLPWPYPSFANPRAELERSVALESTYWRLQDSILTLNRDVDLNHILFIPKGYRIILLPGTNITLKNGGGILSYSPISAMGSQLSPITIIAESPEYNHGLQVISPDSKSSLNWVIFNGLNTMRHKGWNLTGAITFYDTDVTINNCTFSNNSCEDALNLFRCSFEMNSCKIERTFADGFDADFCIGNIKKSVFLNTGNDGLDFSGSTINVNGCDLIGVGDKGISSGEASTITVDNCYISNASMALVSKDQSLLTTANMSIKDCQIQYASYQKKDEFGPAKILVKNVNSNLVTNNVIIDLGSSIEFSDTTIVGVRPISVDSLYAPF